MCVCVYVCVSYCGRVCGVSQVTCHMSCVALYVQYMFICMHELCALMCDQMHAIVYVCVQRDY